jgi:hypothetical protein
LPPESAASGSTAWIAILAEFGAFGTSPPITAPLNSNDTFELMWDGEFVLRTRLPLTDNGNRVGCMIVDQSADYLAQALFDVANLGQTGEIAACLQSGMELLCFPGSRHKSSYAVPRPTAGKRLPMHLALAGQTDDGASVDYRGQNVIAAYGLLAPGLGFVVKEDAVELYAGIRQALQGGATPCCRGTFGRDDSVSGAEALDGTDVGIGVACQGTRVADESLARIRGGGDPDHR